MDYRFYLPVEIFFGKNKILHLNTLHIESPILIVSDPVLKKVGLVDQIKQVLKPKDSIFNFCEVEPNPSCSTVNNGVRYAKERKIKTVIGLGGGSAIDTAKAISCLIDTDGTLQEFLFNGKILKGRTTQLIAIPTTSGTGSEVTNVGVYTDHERGQKKPLVTEYFWPDHAILDPMMTLSMPPRVTASTSLDAFTHAIEAYWADSSQPMSKLFSMEAMKLIMLNIEKTYVSPKDYEGREQLLYASLLAGISFAQTRTTILHALSFPLTNEYGLEHGFACALALPKIIKDNYDSDKPNMDILIRHLNYETVQQFSNKIAEIMKNVNAPTTLSQIGVKREDLERIAQITLSAPISQLNPKKYQQNELVNLLNQIY
ncbi:MAG TPA: iron-containing alcohol dehydrogenase [Thermotogota bacterium]|nr:iron-containing alcohol dehydrogenase [Thermotogota bacterium]